MDNRKELNSSEQTKEEIKKQQRQQLIQWLEGEKSERIRKLYEKPISMPEAKVDTPTPKITEEKIIVNPVFNENIKSVNPYISHIYPEKNINYKFELSEKAFDKIYTIDNKSAKPIDEVPIEINKKELSGIVTVLSVPQKIKLPDLAVNPFSDSVISSSQNISFFPINYQANDIDITTDEIVVSDSVKIPEKPENLIPEINIQKTYDPVDIHFSKTDTSYILDNLPVVTPMQGIIPVVQPLDPLNITAEPVIADNQLSLDLKAVFTPPKTKDTNFAIDIEKNDYSDIVCKINVPESYLEIKTDIKQTDNIFVPKIDAAEPASLNCDVEILTPEISLTKYKLPESNSIHKFDVEILTSEIPSTNHRLPDSTEIPDITVQPMELPLIPEVKTVANAFNISETFCSIPDFQAPPTVSVPRKNTLPIVTENIPELKTVKIPQINVSSSPISVPIARKIQMEKEFSEYTGIIKSPAALKINVNPGEICTANSLSSNISATVPKSVKISDNISFAPLPSIQIMPVSIPDNTSFLESIIDSQTYENKGGST